MALYQRKILATDENVGEPAPLPQDLWGSLTDDDLEHLTDLNPAAHYAGQGFFRVADAEPEPAPRAISRLAFMQRLPAAKRIGIRTAAKTDVVIEDFLDLLSAATLVDLDHADTTQGTAYLVAEGLLTQEEADALLA